MPKESEVWVPLDGYVSRGLVSDYQGMFARRLVINRVRIERCLWLSGVDTPIRLQSAIKRRDERYHVAWSFDRWILSINDKLIYQQILKEKETEDEKLETKFASEFALSFKTGLNIILLKKRQPDEIQVLKISPIRFSRSILAALYWEIKYPSGLVRPISQVS